LFRRRISVVLEILLIQAGVIMRNFLMSLAIAFAVTLAIGSVAATLFVTPSYSGPKTPDADR
jgi:hypothetical protein